MVGKKNSSSGCWHGQPGGDLSGILSQLDILKFGGLVQATPWSPLNTSLTHRINLVTSTFVRKGDQYIHLHYHHLGSKHIRLYPDYPSSLSTFLVSSLGSLFAAQ